MPLFVYSDTCTLQQLHITNIDKSIRDNHISIPEIPQCEFGSFAVEIELLLSSLH